MRYYVAYRLHLGILILYIPMAVLDMMCKFMMQISND